MKAFDHRNLRRRINITDNRRGLRGVVIVYDRNRNPDCHAFAKNPPDQKYQYDGHPKHQGKIPTILHQKIPFSARTVPKRRKELHKT